jgi:type II secretory pathway component PulC
MDANTAQLIILGLVLAEKVVFQIGGKLVEINTSDMTDPEAIQKALAAARAEGFPELKFVSKAEA